MKPEFYFKVFGLAEDCDTGAAEYGYVKLTPKRKSDYTENEYEAAQVALKKMLVKQFGVDEEDIEAISEEEYLDNTEDDEDEDSYAG